MIITSNKEELHVGEVCIVRGHGNERDDRPVRYRGVEVHACHYEGRPQPYVHCFEYLDRLTETSISGYVITPETIKKLEVIKGKGLEVLYAPNKE